MSTHRFSAFVAHSTFWLLISICLALTDALYVLIYLTPFIVCDLWYALTLGFMLRLPIQRKDSPPPVEWTREVLSVADYPVRWLSKAIDPDKPLAILIHGWNSRASNMIGRSVLYEQSGYNTILFEMRAHGGSERVKNWAALHVCHDLENVLNAFEQRGWLKNGFVIHGHSLGGFVAQRVMRPDLHTSKYALGMILESPVTSYEYINNQTCEYLRIPSYFHKTMMNRLLKYYNRINPPIYQVDSVEQLSTPIWGFPSCPTLLIQAKHDATLGTQHAALLIDVHDNSQSDFTFHIVAELNHAYEKENAIRDQLIEEWMETKSLFFG